MLFASPSVGSPGFMAVGSDFSGFTPVALLFHFIGFLLRPELSQLSCSCALWHIYIQTANPVLFPSHLLVMYRYAEGTSVCFWVHILPKYMV